MNARRRGRTVECEPGNLRREFGRMIEQMAHPFQSARRKVARAKEHISTLECKIVAFFDAKPYIRVAEPDTIEPHLEVHKLRFTQGLPDLFATLASDALHNLRDALDNAGYALAVAAGKTNPLHTAFPFGGSAADFENSLGRCKDIAEEIHTLFRAYGPYKGGNDLLWALNKLAVTDKHKLLTIALNSQLGNVHAEGAIHRIPVNPTWDAAKQEIELFTGLVGHPAKGKMEIGLFVSFDDVPFVTGEPVLKVLDYFVEVVEDILSRLDVEAKRLGVFR
jgi:hypothetical protein